MSATVQDVLDLIDDHTSSVTGQVDQTQKIRQITKAVDYFQRKIQMPNDEKIHSFFFSDDQFFYDAPSDFAEELYLVYNISDYNTSDREWSFEDYSELIKKTGKRASGNFWSFTMINGTKQIMALGNNIKKGSLIDDLDTVSTWTASGDASSLAQDLLEKKVGDGSLKFDVTYSTGLATLTKTGLSLDLKTVFENHGFIKLWTWMTNINVDSVVLKLFVDDSNYWTITEDDYDDGTAFAANAWKKVGFPLDDAVETGTPEIDETITKIQIQFTLQADFGSAVDFRVDHMFTTIPDKLDLVYKTNYKGSNASGSRLTKFSAVTDTIAICDYFEGWDDLIARRASLVLFPSLRADKEWYLLYQQDLKDMIRDWGLRFPKKRTNKYIPTKLRRNRP